MLLFVYTLVKISLSMNHCRLKDRLEGGEVQIYLLDRLKGAEVGIYPFLVCVMAGAYELPRREGAVN